MEIEEGLFLIPLDLERRGFRNFISSWVVRHDALAFVVDPGPKRTMPILLDALTRLGIRHLDCILLTHIHIDHAGGTGLLSDRFPEARVVCHPKARNHLVDPSRLWEGSQKVLGSLAEAYGEIVPLREDSIVLTPLIEKEGQTIACIETPGHAVHHMSYLFNHILFAGEVAGVYVDLGDSNRYLRPATPPPFKLDISMDSLETVATHRPSWICFGHFGMSKSAVEILHQARDQLTTWTRVIKDLLDESEHGIVERAFTALQEADPCFRNFHTLDDDIRDRERYFFGNTVQGMVGYIRESKGASG